MAAHVFVDNSNIFGGASRAARDLEPHVPWMAVRVYYKNFFDLIENGRDVVTRVMAGSVPPGNDALWEYAHDYGYDTDLLHKIEKDDGHVGEQAVDEILHLKIANSIIDYEAPQVLVLATGDGRPTPTGTSFTKQAERALKRGWQVEVWSWKAQLSPEFSKLTRPGRPVHVKKLDPFYNSITFVKGGTYTLESGDVIVKERIVRPLTHQLAPA